MNGPARSRRRSVADVLKAALSEAGWQNRTLARHLATRYFNGTSVEQVRVDVRRWRKMRDPKQGLSDENAERVAVTLREDAKVPWVTRELLAKPKLSERDRLLREARRLRQRAAELERRRRELEDQ